MVVRLPVRFADEDTAARYPLPVTGPLDWRADGAGWRADIPLPALPGGTILVPSLALLGADYSFRFTLRRGNDRWTLAPVPNAVGASGPGGTPAAPPPGADVTTHVDCYHLAAELAGATLDLRVSASAAPARYVVTVTARPLELDAVPPPAFRASAQAPPPLSQLDAEPRIARRICSPACTAMVLAGFGRPAPLATVAGACFDPVTNLYGIWPLALRTAAGFGSIGAVEVFAGWDEVSPVLAAGLPLITSIRFGTGELPGTPMRATGGHLVVLHGAAPDTVAVNDPAAWPARAVPRVYPAAPFGRAWLRHRGAAYILLP